MELVRTKQQNGAGQGRGVAGMRRGETKLGQGPMGTSEQCVAEKTNGAVQGVARRTETGQARHDGRGEDSRSGVPSWTLRRAESHG